MDILPLLKAADLLLNMLAKLGINLAKYNAMRELSGGELTNEQRQQLVTERDEAINKL